MPLQSACIPNRLVDLATKKTTNGEEMGELRRDKLLFDDLYQLTTPFQLTQVNGTFLLLLTIG